MLSDVYFLFFLHPHFGFKYRNLSDFSWKEVSQKRDYNACGMLDPVQGQFLSLDFARMKCQHFCKVSFNRFSSLNYAAES